LIVFSNVVGAGLFSINFGIGTANGFIGAGLAIFAASIVVLAGTLISTNLLQIWQLSDPILTFVGELLDKDVGLAVRVAYW
jgi:hypothetical protein